MRSFLQTSLTVCALAAGASGADRVWTGLSAVNGNLSSPANWQNAVPPAAGDNALFTNPTAARAIVSVTSSPALGSLILQGTSSVGPYQFLGAGPTLTLATELNIGTGTPATLTSSVIINAANTSLATGSSLSIRNNARLFSGNLFNFGEVEAGVDGTLSIESGSETSLGGTLRASDGGTIIGLAFLDIGVDSAGTLVVTGPGSTLTAGEKGALFTDWATVDGAASVTIGNSGVATYRSGLRVAASFGTANLAVVDIHTGGRLNVEQQLIAGGAGTATFNINSGTLHAFGDASLLTGAQINWTAGHVVFGGAVHTSGNARLTLSPSTDKILLAASLEMVGSSRIDLSDNAMIVNYTGSSPIGAITGYIATGRNGGNWLGNFLRSSAAAVTPGRALGVADASAIGSPRTFLGEPVDDTSVLIRYTLAGDADLTGSVDLDDFTRLAAAFGTPAGWSSGDFNYDGTTNLDDFTALAANFGQTLPSGEARSPAVPEPAGISAVALPLVLFRRRR